MIARGAFAAQLPYVTGLTISAREPRLMTAPQPNRLLEAADLDPARARAIVADALDGADDGELFVEYSQSETLMFDNGRLKHANFDTEQGFGLRAVAGEAAGYAHSGDISEAALKRAADAVAAVKRGYAGS